MNAQEIADYLEGPRVDKPLRGLFVPTFTADEVDVIVAALRSSARPEAALTCWKASPAACRAEIIEECAAIPQLWVDAPSCTPDAPCEHKRTAYEIARRIRALKDKPAPQSGSE